MSRGTDLSRFRINVACGDELYASCSTCSGDFDLSGDTAREILNDLYAHKCAKESE
jgi:hypothetical protein